MYNFREYRKQLLHFLEKKNSWQKFLHLLVEQTVCLRSSDCCFYFIYYYVLL